MKTGNGWKQEMDRSSSEKYRSHDWLYPGTRNWTKKVDAANIAVLGWIKDVWRSWRRLRKSKNRKIRRKIPRTTTNNKCLLHNGGSGYCHLPIPTSSDKFPWIWKKRFQILGKIFRSDRFLGIIIPDLKKGTTSVSPMWVRCDPPPKKNL